MEESLLIFGLTDEFEAAFKQNIPHRQDLSKSMKKVPGSSITTHSHLILYALVRKKFCLSRKDWDRIP
jgi:hypothetical protein